VRKLHQGLILIVGLALILALILPWAARWKAMRDLQAVRQELLAVTTANEFLKTTLGEMTIAMTAKEKEIDRLEHAACGGQGKKQPPARPIRMIADR